MAKKMELDRGRQTGPQLYEFLRQKIIDLKLAPGAVLSRAELAAEYKISQTPVREALLKLAQENLVDVIPQASTRVSLIDVSFARETHFLRQSIELELVRELTLNPNPAATDALQSLLQRLEVLRDTGKLAAFTEADRAFHFTLYEYTNKEPLWHLVRSRSGHLDRLRRLHLPVVGKQNLIIDDHQRILKAMVAQDVAEAQQALRDHLSGTLVYVSQLQTDYPDLFAYE